MSPPAGQDVNDKWSFQHPELYLPGQLNLYFSKKAFFKCALHSCYSSLVLFFIPYAAMHDTVRADGKDVADYQSFALLTQTCLLFTVTIQVPWEPFCTLFPLFVSDSKNTDAFVVCSPSPVSPVGVGDVLLDGGEHPLRGGQSGHVLRRHLHHVQ